MSSTTDCGEVINKLDTIIAILQLAFKDRIDDARQQIRSDPVAAEILEIAANDWIEAGDLKSQVAQRTKQSVKTVERRIAALVAQRVLDRTGSGPRVRFRASGLI